MLGELGDRQLVAGARHLGVVVLEVDRGQPQPLLGVGELAAQPGVVALELGELLLELARLGGERLVLGDVDLGGDVGIEAGLGRDAPVGGVGVVAARVAQLAGQAIALERHLGELGAG
ncbi:MAG: hypothetical protein E6J91_29525, partial [Deltaproteobacteria bacterium]